ncbi:MarR family transcriptional regulator [Alcaligenaceae bacterium CGII-47]|nr:MarR family transcriptional regulator [Alcaligenaceae bacterium CGII-47]
MKNATHPEPDEFDVIEGRSYRSSALYWIGILDKAINAQFTAEMGAARSIVARWRTLSILVENNGLFITDLANETFIERTALSRLLDSMEHEGLLERVPRPNDRRNIEVHITDKGREAFEIMLPIRRAVFQRAVAGMDQEELRQLLKSIRRLVDNLMANE